MKYTYLPEAAKNIIDVVYNEICDDGAYALSGGVASKAIENWKFLSLLSILLMKKNEIDIPFLFLEKDSEFYSESDEIEVFEFLELMDIAMDKVVYALTLYDWEVVYDKYYHSDRCEEFRIDETPLKLFKDSNMSVYMNNGKLDCDESEFYQFYVISNRRLGIFLNFAKSRAVEKDLLLRIHQAIDIIGALRGYEIYGSGMDDDGNFVIAYIMHSQPEYKNYTFACYPLIMIYAKELSLLLDEAFDKYHLEITEPRKAG